MNRNAVKIGVVVAIVVVVGVAMFALNANNGDDTATTTIELPAEDEPGGVPTSSVEPVPETPGAGQVDPDVSVDDPVPDDLVSVLFGLIEDAGDAPLMNETYTVEFGETTDYVTIQGTFENGPAAYEFEFDDGAWKLEQAGE